MSQAEIEQLRAVYDAVNHGDWDAAFDDARPDFELVPPDQNPIAGTYRGRAAIRAFFDEMWAAFDEVTAEPGPFLEADDQIVVSLAMRLRPSDSAAAVEMQITHVWTMRDGKPARCEVFYRREQALEAVGLSEQAMSQENVEIVCRIYAALDVSVPGSVGTVSVPTEPFGEFIDPQIEWNGPREFPDLAEPHYGYEGVKRYLRTIAEVLDDYRMVPERFIDAGDDRVLVFSREGGRGKGSGAEVQTHLTAHLWTLKEGKAVRMQSYWERADALEAVGLSE